MGCRGAASRGTPCPGVALQRQVRHLGGRIVRGHTPREHADGQDFYELGIDAWDLLITDIACDTFLHEIEGGSGWRPPEADLDHLDQKVP